jgi:hypothetical protein
MGRLTSAFTGAKPASEAPLVERPVQGMVGPLPLTLTALVPHSRALGFLGNRAFSSLHDRTPSNVRSNRQSGHLSPRDWRRLLHRRGRACELRA